MSREVLDRPSRIIRVIGGAIFIATVAIPTYVFRDYRGYDMHPHTDTETDPSYTTTTQPPPEESLPQEDGEE